MVLVVGEATGVGRESEGDTLGAREDKREGLVEEWGEGFTMPVGLGGVLGLLGGVFSTDISFVLAIESNFESTFTKQQHISLL